MEGAGGGVGGQLLMLSPNLLKSHISMSRVGGWGEVGSQFLMLGPNLLKSKKNLQGVG